MNKEQVFERILGRCSVEKEVLEKEFNELLVKTKEKISDETNAQQAAALRLYTLYKQQIASPAKKYEGYILFATDTSDFGAAKKYAEIKKAWDNAADDYKEEMIAQGIVDSEGNPLWKTTNFKNGQKIIPEENLARTVFLLAKDKEEPGELKLSTLVLRGEKAKEKLPRLVKVDFRANPNKDKSTEEMTVLNQSVVTKFTPTSPEDRIDPKEVAMKYLGKHIINTLAELRAWHDANENDFNRLCIIKGMASIKPTKPGISQLIEIEDGTLPIDVPLPVWCPRDYEIDFEDGAPDVIVIGKTNVRDDKLMVNAYGVYAPEEWRVKDSPKEITEETEEEDNEFDG